MPDGYTTKILPCDCKNDGQDKIHGPGRRVHNQMKPDAKSSVKQYRCTVCNREKTP